MPARVITCLLIFYLCIYSAVNAQQSVLTQHNNLNRTGWYNEEKFLKKSNVQPGAFGKIFTRDVDDQIYAQPLIKLNVNIPGKGNKNVVFVATVNNSVYAFDADSAKVTAPYWQVNLTAAGARVVSKNDMTGACGGFYNDFSGNVGIVGTPVIDSTTNTIYLVARSYNESTATFLQYLHALDITTGAEKPNSPVAISATVSGNGEGSINGTVSFDSQKNNQRPGLALVNNIIYIGWSSHCDWGPYHGWVMSYDKTSLQQQHVYCTTPDGYYGGIWMSGGAPSVDENGNVYVAVGNGSVGKDGNPANLRNRSESALKLSSSLQLNSFFTPNNYETLEGADLDFGVTQLMLIPNTNRGVVGVKDGKIYLLNRDDLGGYNAGGNLALQTIDLGSNSFLRSSMSYYKGEQKEYVFSWSENSLLRAFPYSRTTNLFDLNSTISSGIQGPTGNNGALLSVSSNGSADSTAILWASYAANGDANQSVRPGILRAIDATDVTKELWNSADDATDDPGNYAKFNCPTVANGKVYLATFSNQLIVYGLTNKSPITDSCGKKNIALNKNTFESSEESFDHSSYYATDGDVTTRWASAQGSDPQFFTVDLGSVYDLCRVVIRWEVALGEDYKIQVSDDNNTWTDAATITGNTSYTNTVSLSGSGRYIRMYGTKRGTPYGYSIYEFQVYGVNTSTNKCTTPDKVYATNVYETEATLNWTSTKAPKYLVEYKTVTGTIWIQNVVTDNSITLQNLSCNTPYLFRVKAVCGNGDSSYFSPGGAFTTLTCDVACDPLPTRWSTTDVGDVGVNGAACFNSTTETFELKGSGTDIWDTNDEFRFAYKTLVGNGEIIARVIDLDATNPWNKTGIMIRESLDPGSRHVFMALTSGNGAAWQNRTFTNSISNNENIEGITAPYWIRVVINGSNYSGYISPDGSSWTQVGTTVDAGFGDGMPMYAGLAITSHDNSVISTAHIDNYRLEGLLPLKLISFTGTLSLKQTVELQWITTLETNMKNFIVERTTDFIHYTSIDTVEAENSGDYTEVYKSVDLLPLRPVSYYRLRITDKDGSINYSPVVAIKINNGNPPQLYPNPASSLVKITRGSENIRQVTVYDVMGKAVKRISGNGNTQIEIPAYNLANGLYFVEIRTEGSTYREKLVIHN